MNQTARKNAHQQTAARKLLQGTTPGMANTDFLGQIDASRREELLSSATRLSLRKGEFIFRAGDSGDTVFLLLAGRVKTYKISPSGREVILWFGFPGEVFGLVETPQHRGRMVNVQACEDTEIAKVSGAHFRKFLASHAEVSQLCIRVVASRLGMLANRLVYLMADNAEARIAKLLVDLAARYHDPKNAAEHPVGLTHQEIANITGVQRQTVTRILGKFTERGALSVHYRNISIRDRELLMRYAARHP
jgi:CRP/FNR family cyclic AMP-dependent transcriptional regulator